MALSCFPGISNHIELSDGTRYAYVYVKPATVSQHTFLLLHGFPSSSYGWRHQIKALANKGFGVLAPDLLGYGDTDSPIEVEAYSKKKISGHVAEILSSLGIQKVIGVGHDWGSVLLGRLYTWHPEYLVALIFLAVGYIEPSDTPLDLDGINAMTHELLGYSTFGYWKLFDTEEAGKLLDTNPDSVESLMYPADPETWKTHLGPIGAAKAWITSNITTATPTWLTTEESTTHKQVFSKNGYTGPLNWYKSTIRGLDAADEASVPEERKYLNLPTLLVLAKNDHIISPDMQKTAAVKWAKHLRIEELSCGHWIQLELPEKVNELLSDYATNIVK